MGDALQEYLNKSRLKPRLLEIKVQENWEMLMGKTISRYTQSIALIDGKLIITTAVGPLKQELSYSKDKIVKLVNEMLGEPAIREVIIK
jgi:predicted nucleic acid-binding Zn ribbon protein